jgi:hypothetical protein
MFRHVVLLRFDERAPEGHAASVAEELRSLPRTVPTLRSYLVGEDLGLGDDNADLAVIAEFDDRAGWELYRDHPEHRRIIEERITPHLRSRSATQFEGTGPPASTG